MSLYQNDYTIVQKPENVSYDEVCEVVSRSFDDVFKTLGVVFSSPDIKGYELKEIIDSNNGVCFVAMSENKVIGTLSCVVRPQNCWFYKGDGVKIRFVAVLPEFYGRKIASGLIKKAKQFATDNGYATAMVSTPANNTPAILLYKKLGFTPVRYRLHNDREIVDFIFFTNDMPHSKIKCSYEFNKSKLKCRLKKLFKRK